MRARVPDNGTWQEKSSNELAQRLDNLPLANAAAAAAAADENGAVENCYDTIQSKALACCSALALELELTKPADDIASLQKQTVSPSSRSHPKPSIPHVQSSHSTRSKTAATCWYHTTFGVKARRCNSPCSFTSKQSKRVKPVNPKVCAANFPDGSNPGRIFYVRDTRSGRRFLVDTGAQLGVIPPTPADRLCPNPGLFSCCLQCCCWRGSSTKSARFYRAFGFLLEETIQNRNPLQHIRT
ncbi:hypothetical protein SprV_1002867700 [Sparganum proliferum]